jgi:Periplasmic sensor domain
MPQKSGIQRRAAVTMLGTALLAFFIFGALFVAYRIESRQLRVVETFNPYLELVSSAAVPSLNAEDSGRAAEILAGLKANPQILRADIVFADGRTLATYPAGSAPLGTNLPAQPWGGATLF